MNRYVKGICAFLLMTCAVCFLTLIIPGKSMASERPVQKMTFECDTNGTKGTAGIISCELTEYSGYYRHRDGELITEPSQMKVSAKSSGSVISAEISGLLDYEDWKLRIVYDYKWIETSAVSGGGIVKNERHVKKEHYFSGTTDKDTGVHDGYELREKLRKYPSLKLVKDIKTDVGGTVVIDGAVSGWKSTAAHFNRTDIDLCGHVIGAGSDLFEIKNSSLLCMKNGKLHAGGRVLSVSDGKADIEGCELAGSKKAVFIDRKGSLELKDTSVYCSGGICIDSRSKDRLSIKNSYLKGNIGLDNNGDGLYDIAKKVIIIPAEGRKPAYVDSSLEDVGTASVVMEDTMINTDGTAIKNTGNIVLKGSMDIKSSIGLDNMGKAVLDGSSVSVTASDTGIINGSWFHVIMDVIKEKDSSYTYYERYDIAKSLYGDMCAYAIDASAAFIKGSGSCRISGGSSGVKNAGTLSIEAGGAVITSENTCVDNSGYVLMSAGHIGGGASGVDNKGQLVQSGGIITGNSKYGVIQKGIYDMSDRAVVGNDNVIHLAKGRIINVTGLLKEKECGVISLAGSDIYPGHVVIDACGLDAKEADLIAGDSPNGVLPKSGKFKTVFKYVNGHPGALRSGKGEEYNGKRGTVILSALYEASYLCGIDDPPSGMTFETPKITKYFWNEPAVFHTGSDIEKNSSVRVYYDDKNITPSFRQKGWKDEDGFYHSKDIERIYDDDHSFTAVWDPAFTLWFHGNNDTYDDGKVTLGKKDYRCEKSPAGSVIPGNTPPPGEPYYAYDRNEINKYGYFRKSIIPADEKNGYLQRFAYNGWTLKRDSKEKDLYKAPGEKTDLLLAFKALETNSVTYEPEGDGYVVVIHFYAVWDAFPRVFAGNVYISDRQFGDEAALGKTIMSSSKVSAYDVEDGVIDNIKIFTDPVNKSFSIKAFKNTGNIGSVPVYFSAVDSLGSEVICRSECFVISGDDEDRYEEDKGTSPFYMNASPIYIRYIDKEYLSTLESRSKWRGGRNKKLLGSAFEDRINEHYSYDHDELLKIRELIKKDENDERLSELLGFYREEETARKLPIRVEIQSGLSSLEVSWEYIRGADTARITYSGENGGMIEVPANECAKVLTGLGENNRYAVSVELKKGGKIIAEGKSTAYTQSIKAPEIRVDIRENGKHADILFTGCSFASLYEIQRQRLTKDGYQGWAMVATLRADTLTARGLAPGSLCREYIFGDSIKSGRYRYRIRAVGYSLGSEDIRMSYQSKYTVSRES